MHISQKPLNCSTPESSPEKSSINENCGSNGDLNGSYFSHVVAFDDLESAFLANIGNWKKLRRQDNKDIYKCSECDCKLEVEKKGSQIRVRVRNPLSSVAHNWFDFQHLAPFNDNNSDNSPTARMHTSAEAFIKIQLRENVNSFLSPNELLETMKRERPKLYQFFKPTIQ